MLIPEWQRAWRLLSVQIASGAVLFGSLPADQQQSILAALHVPAERLPAVLGLVFLAGRLLSQAPKDEPPEPGR